MIIFLRFNYKLVGIPSLRLLKIWLSHSIILLIGRAVYFSHSELLFLLSFRDLFDPHWRHTLCSHGSTVSLFEISRKLNILLLKPEHWNSQGKLQAALHHMSCRCDGAMNGALVGDCPGLSERLQCCEYQLTGSLPADGRLQIATTLHGES